MTPDMAFECLLVTRDAGVFSTVSRILRDLSICTDVCLSPSKALNLLAKGSTDLIVIDWEEGSSELLHEIWKPGNWHKPTVVAISSQDRCVPCAHVALKKPLTDESSRKSLRFAYSIMLQDYRRHARYALMMSLIARDDRDRTVPVTIMDIGDGGVGLRSEQEFTVGAILSFHLLLPGANRDIYIHARVLWTREFGRVGCEFLRVPPVDLNFLQDWLKQKLQVKKPLTET
ncbi:MAG: PilZ domain-containing protein [Candidatus Sulfotelmatobacter sp.]|jgi:PilZ domain-containing protein